MASKTTSTVINLGSQRISLASIVGASKGALALTRYHQYDIEGDPSTDATRVPQLQMGVKSVVDEAKVKGSNVRCAIAGHPVFMRFVKLPPLSEDKVDQIVEFEAQQNVPFPIDEVSWGYQLIGEPGSVDVEVLLAAIKADELSAVNSAVERAGVKTLSVDVSPMLVYNAFRFNYSDQAKSVMILDIGARSANLIYAEPGRVFISPCRVGGASFTQALAKEMDIPFEAAEQLKLQQGSLGAPGEEPADEQAGAIQSVLRAAVTRLHGEIVRTNNRYKTQQGGSLPEVIYLAGRASGTPYLAHFLQEKLGVPVEYFNALRNVSVGPKVSQEAVAAEAHTMGELVGLALRNREGSPIELELVPEQLANARDLESRKPALVTAAIALIGGLAAAVFYFTAATQKIEEQQAFVDREVEGLNEIQSGISQAERELQAIHGRTDPFTQTVLDRSYWARFLSDLNGRLKSPEVWFTSLEPTVGGNSITKEIGEDGKGAIKSRDLGKVVDVPKGRKATAVDVNVDSLTLKGLFRSPARPTIISDTLMAELNGSPYFKLTGKDEDGNEIEIADLVSYSDGLDDSVWAWRFELKLPLNEPLTIATLGN